ncbi:hypothetical protein DMENIID0001_056860 [Sergentomyia squamirostris]
MDILVTEKFSLLDYSFFVLVFFVSAGIGLYYAIQSRRVNTVDQYLLGGRKMGLLPVCCSLVATSVSGFSMIGLPAESYAYGTYTWIYSIQELIVAALLHFIFLEMFFELKLTSCFKYFEMRFNRKVRLLASGIFLFCGLLYLPVTVYTPALTFQRVTGVNVYVIVIVLSVLCASYTAIGGFKAVVWTDVFQLVLMISSLIIVVVVGTQGVGGIDNVIQAAKRGQRIVIAYDNLNSRTSAFGMILSNTLIIIYQSGFNQASLQRYLSLSDIVKMKISVWFVALTFTLIVFLVNFLGPVMYANYETCDPLSAGLIKKMDQILPHFVQEKASLFPGFNGIFIAGVFSASLSTTSSYLNAMSGIIYEDFISHRFPNLSDRTVNRILKNLVLVLGVLQIAFVFFIQMMGTIFQITVQCVALQCSTMITLFFLGMLFPKANSKGATVGALTCMIGVLSLIIGGLNNKPEPTLPLRTDGCEHQLNITSIPSQGLENSEDDTFWLFRLNFVYYTLVGTVIGITVGYLTSLATGGERVKNQKLLAVFLRVHEPREEEMRLRRKNTAESVDMCD